MSGPVWKLLRLSGARDSCGENVKERLAVGTVVDFSFHPDFSFCPVCYERYKGRRDELNQKAVEEQQIPPFVSRPS
jgi:hypothetical protein